MRRRVVVAACTLLVRAVPKVSGRSALTWEAGFAYDAWCHNYDAPILMCQKEYCFADHVSPAKNAIPKPDSTTSAQDTTAPTWGRWMSPDWADRPTSVPYADFGDPQTLNLYGYVRNNPLSHADTDGHCWPTCTWVAGAAIGGAVGAVGNAYSQWKSNGHSIAAIDTQRVASSALGGAISGGLAGATLGVSLLRNTAVGAGANVIGGMVQRATSGDSSQHAVDGKQMLSNAESGAISGIAGTAVAKGLVSSTVATPSGQSAVENLSNPSAYDAVKTTTGLRPVAEVQLKINTVATAAGNAASQTASAVQNSQEKKKDGQ
jgi:hypothetical protein